MPGVKGRSGRRTLIPTAPDHGIPPPGSDERSVRDHLIAVSMAIAENKIDARVGDTLIKAANAVLTSLKQEHSRTAVVELRQILEEAKSVAQAGLQREVKDRQHGK